MKRKIKYSGITIGIILLFIITMLIANSNDGLTTDKHSDVERNKEAEIEATREPEEEMEIAIASLGIHPAGGGFVSWYNSYENMMTDTDGELVSFEISPDKKVTFVENEPEDEGIRNIIVKEIQENHRQNIRAINFIEGTMNENLTEGIMPYYSSEQIRGEVRFVVEGDEIIKNQDDWDALPETDEDTSDDFYHTADLMIQNWGRNYESDH